MISEFDFIYRYVEVRFDESMAYFEGSISSTYGTTNYTNDDTLIECSELGPNKLSWRVSCANSTTWDVVPDLSSLTEEEFFQYCTVHELSISLYKLLAVQKYYRENYDSISNNINKITLVRLSCEEE